jgi:nicotinamide-nucleotide amidase
MHAEIISVGTEMTSGARLDTNSQWLSQRLGELGILTRYHTTVADDLTANVEVFRLAIARADVVLLTGGLGPTLDDLTRQALAAAVGVDLFEDSISLRAIEDHFARRGRPMPASNRMQALFPVGSTPLPNPVGSAPGIWMEVPREGRGPCRFAAMPGVPSEMKPMFRDLIRTRLAGGVVIRAAKLNCFGLGESHTEELLGDLTGRGRDPDVGITAHDATISLRILAQGRTEAECFTKIDAAKREIHARLGDHVFGVDDEEPEHVVVRGLVERGQTLSVCETATGGNLIERLLAIPDAHRVCPGGLVLSDRSDFARLLGFPVVPGELQNASVGHDLARRLAAACRQRFQSEYALSVTPWGSVTLESGATVPTSWVGLAGANVAHSTEVRQTGNPAINAPRTSKTALDLLRRHLQGLALPQ